MSSSRVLLVVSADRRSDEAKFERGEAPRRDYVELARHLDADIFDFGMVRASRLGKLGDSKLASAGLLHAWQASSRFGRYDVVFSDNERVGVFVGMLLRLRRRAPAHVMLAHHLTPAKKRPLLRLARKGTACLIVHSQAQRRLAMQELGYASEQVFLHPYQVDTEFWRPLGRSQEDLICSAGLECRDYPTFLRAVQDLPVQVKIGAASPWSRKRSLIDPAALPPNVEARPFDYLELREVYDRSRVVAVPLLDVDFQAGITLILEAMAMARPVVATASRGLPEPVVGPVWQAGQRSWPAQMPLAECCGILVAPGDSAAMRDAIAYLLANPDTARRLGEHGRLQAERDFSLARFAERFAATIRGCLDAKRGRRMAAAR